MPIRSDFPAGFLNGVTLRGMPIVQAHPGEVFWVYNGTAVLKGQRGGSDQNKGTFNSPFSTLAGAVAQCVANRGDIIMVKPGHAETISSATALTMSIAGVAVVGLGNGTNRPKFTLDTANTARSTSRRPTSASRTASSSPTSCRSRRASC
jgi:calcineurin-like phosphoesterase